MHVPSFFIYVSSYLPFFVNNLFHHNMSDSIEFMLREFNTGSYPRGLSIMLSSLSQWLYGRDPLDALRFETPLQELKEELGRGEPVFADMVKKLLLNNKHRVSVVMEADEHVSKLQEEREVNRLAEIKSKMSEKEIEQVTTVFSSCFDITLMIFHVLICRLFETPCC
jgi:Zn-dependent M16 (insulinase) family peptidase